MQLKATIRGLRNVSSLLLCLMVLATQIALAQVDSAAPLPDAVIRKNVHEVTLVFTADKKGRPVRDLAAEHLTVVDDGRPVARLTSFAHAADLPLKVTILLDISGTMAEKFGFESQVAQDFLSHLLRPQDTGTLVAFNDTASFIDFSVSATETLANIRKQNPRGGTAIRDAVGAAAAHLTARENTPARKAILMVTDGDDNRSKATIAEAIEAALRAEAAVLVVNTAPRVHPDMRLLARETGGQVWNALSKGEVATAFRHAEESLRSQYVLAYHPPEFVADGRFREIRIALQEPGLRVRCRKGYFASAAPPKP